MTERDGWGKERGERGEHAPLLFTNNIARQARRIAWCEGGERGPDFALIVIYGKSLFNKEPHKRNNQLGEREGVLPELAFIQRSTRSPTMCLEIRGRCDRREKKWPLPLKQVVLSKCSCYLDGHFGKIEKRRISWKKVSLAEIYEMNTTDAPRPPFMD